MVSTQPGTTETKDPLYESLWNPSNSKTKEALLNYKLCFDLKLAAMQSGYDLTIATTDVDRYGFDLILDDNSYIKKIQVKTVLDKSTTSGWFIHKSIIRPRYDFSERLGFECSPTGSGVEGGVILIKVSVKDGQLVTGYWYTDVFVIRALELNLFSKKRSSKVFSQYYTNIGDGVSHDKVWIPESLFVEVKNSDSLLSIMGMHSSLSHVWWGSLLEVSNYHLTKPTGNNQIPDQIVAFKNMLETSLLEITI